MNYRDDLLEEVEDAKTIHELDQFVGAISNVYNKKNICPPFALRERVRQWKRAGISVAHCVEQVRKHLEICGRQYERSGSGDKGIDWLNAIIVMTWNRRNPRPDRYTLDIFDDEGHLCVDLPDER